MIHNTYLALAEHLDNLIRKTIEVKKEGLTFSSDALLVNLFQLRDELHKAQMDNYKAEPKGEREEEDIKGEDIKEAPPEEGTKEASKETPEEITNGETDTMIPHHNTGYSESFIQLPPALTPKEYTNIANAKTNGSDPIPEDAAHIILVATEGKTAKLPAFLCRKEANGSLWCRATLPSNSLPAEALITEAILLVSWRRVAIWRLDRIPGSLSILIEWYVKPDGTIAE